MFPSLVLENQFGEVSNNFVKGGSFQAWCKFKVAHTDVGGFGITNLSGDGSISAVFMNTNQTPGTGNPNPIAGNILVQFLHRYTSLVGFQTLIRAPGTGSDVNITSGLSLGKAYVITAVGTSTPTNWQALGLPAGVTPAVGAVFIATSASAGSGTGTVQLMATAASAITHLEFVGDPNKTLDLSTGPDYVVLAGIGIATSADVLAAPADGTWIHLGFNLTPVPAVLI